MYTAESKGKRLAQILTAPNLRQHSVTAPRFLIKIGLHWCCQPRKNDLYLLFYYFFKKYFYYHTKIDGNFF